MPTGPYASIPRGVYRGAYGTKPGHVVSGGPGIGAIESYEAWLGLPVSHVLDYMANVPPSWASFETATLYYDGTKATSYKAGAWATDLGTRTLVLATPACCGASTGSGATTWAEEAAGASDTHWTNLGEYLVANGLANATLRIAREFNHGGYAWQVTGVTGMAVTDFQNGWNHIVGVLRAVPGQAFRFQWNPTAATTIYGSTATSAAFPGTATVDEIGIDIYDWSSVYYDWTTTTRTLTEQQEHWSNEAQPDLSSWISFASTEGLPLCLPEWGLVLWGSPPNYRGGGDDDWFVNQMARYPIGGANFGWHAYWEDPGVGLFDSSNAAVDPVNARQAFLGNFGVTAAPPAPPALILSTQVLPDAARGAPYSAQCSASGGVAPYMWGASGLPAGLVIDQVTGLISGTPGTPGNYTVALSVTDAAGQHDMALLALTVTGQVVPVGGIPATDSPYTYLVADLLSGAILGELPLTQVTYQDQLNGEGSFSATLPMGDPAVVVLDTATLTAPGRTALLVDRGGVLVWGGIIWANPYDSSQRSRSLSGSNFLSYLDWRLLHTNLSYTDADLFDIVRALFADMASTPSGDIGFVMPSGLAGGAPTTVSFQAWQETYSSALQTLGSSASGTNAASSASGFDYAVRVVWDASGNAVKTLALGAPHLGSTTDETGLMAEYPGNMIGYTEGPVAPASQTVDIGGTPSKQQNPIVAVATMQSWLAEGYPLLESSHSYSNITNQAWLANLANADLEADSQPDTLTVYLVDDQDPFPGSYVVGDAIRVRITDLNYPDTYDETWRITAITATPPTKTSIGTVQLDLDQL